MNNIAKNEIKHIFQLFISGLQIHSKLKSHQFLSWTTIDIKVDYVSVKMMRI